MTQPDTILESALTTYGYDHQRLMLFEEFAELQDALCKLSRGRATAKDVITEIADVAIMCRQMAIHFGVDAVEKEIQRKLRRLSRTIKTDKNDLDNREQ